MSKPTKLTIILARALSKSLGVFDECGELGVIEGLLAVYLVPRATLYPSGVTIAKFVDTDIAGDKFGVVWGAVGGN